MELRDERRGLAQQGLPLRRIHPALQISLGVETQDRHPIVLHTRDQGLEAIALKAARRFS